MVSSFQRAYPPAQPSSDVAYWFPFYDHKFLVQEHEQGQKELIYNTSVAMAPLCSTERYYLGTFNDTPCIACQIDPQTSIPQNWRALDIRALFGQIDDALFAIVGYASHLLYWVCHHHYCSNCGHLTESIPSTWGRICPNCDFATYPTVTPAILALVHDDRRVLLVGKPGWGQRRSIIAGFVEPGETLEECVRREVFEEVGIEITNITYVANQPWPYPDQLMVGFTARYAGGELRLDRSELAAGDWYTPDELPDLPSPVSLAYHIITQWVEQRKRGEQS
jgi:NAD+ diphosphatase